MLTFLPMRSVSRSMNWLGVRVTCLPNLSPATSEFELVICATIALCHFYYILSTCGGVSLYQSLIVRVSGLTYLWILAAIIGST